MRIVPAIFSALALFLLAGCSDSEWQVSGDPDSPRAPPFDLESYGPVSNIENAALRSVVERVLADDRETASDTVAAEWDCRDFAYRPHLTEPDQFMVRCRGYLFFVVRDGVPVAQTHWVH